MIVIDASVLTDFLLGRSQAVEALDLELRDTPHETLHAPDLIEPETLNALGGLARGGAITDRRATEAVHDLADLRLACYPHAPLRPRVWELRGNLTSYDAMYLALAEALEDAVLMTADGGLAKLASRILGPHVVRCI